MSFIKKTADAAYRRNARVVPQVEALEQRNLAAADLIQMPVVIEVRNLIPTTQILPYLEQDIVGTKATKGIDMGPVDVRTKQAAMELPVASLLPYIEQEGLIRTPAK